MTLKAKMEILDQLCPWEKKKKHSLATKRRENRMNMLSK
jgi:hypothetical protein